MSDTTRDELAAEWEIVENVRCVVCPSCAFTFDAIHDDDGEGHYSCPECECSELRLNQVNFDSVRARLAKANDRIDRLVADRSAAAVEWVYTALKDQQFIAVPVVKEFVPGFGEVWMKPQEEE